MYRPRIALSGIGFGHSHGVMALVARVGDRTITRIPGEQDWDFQCRALQLAQDTGAG